MKIPFFTILLAALSTTSFAQENETSLKKQIVSIDIGFLGTWINYERHLTQLFTLKSELGLEGGLGQGFLSEGKTYFAFTPTIRLEPRYYYSFDRRFRLGKRTSYNASNYFALTATYIANLFTISNVSNIEFQQGVLLIPKWGMQRTIGKRMNFQFAFGAGPFFSRMETVIHAGLDLRFGYNF